MPQYIPVIFPHYNTEHRFGTSLPVGHAGFVLVDNQGSATYYEFGRYPAGSPGVTTNNSAGNLRVQGLGNVGSGQAGAGGESRGRVAIGVAVQSQASSIEAPDNGCAVSGDAGKKDTGLGKQRVSLGVVLPRRVDGEGCAQSRADDGPADLAALGERRRGHAAGAIGRSSPRRRRESKTGQQHGGQWRRARRAVGGRREMNRAFHQSLTTESGRARNVHSTTRSHMIRHFSIFAMLVVSMICSARAAPSEPERPVLTREFDIPMIEPSSRGAWSEDGQFLLINQLGGSHSGHRVIDTGFQIIDVKNRKVGPFLKQAIGLNPFIWSSSRKYVAISNARQIFLLDGATMQELKRIDQPNIGCNLSTESDHSLRFDADERGLWVTCGGRKETPSFLAAVHVSIPDLKVIDGLRIDNPEPGEAFFVGAPSIVREGSRAIFVGEMRVSTKRPGGGFPTHRSHSHFCGVDLRTRNAVFPSINLDAIGFLDRGTGDPEYHLGREIVTFISNFTSADEKQEAFINLVDARAGRIVADQKLTDDHRLVGLKKLLFSKSGRFLFGTAGGNRETRGADRSKFGSLLVWEVDGLRLIQHFYDVRFSWTQVSPDGSRLATMTNNAIRFYTISE
jgi:hypothetical protein